MYNFLIANYPRMVIYIMCHDQVERNGKKMEEKSTNKLLAEYC